ncbi:MAG: hypothetical protein Q9226_001638 [Calogaya cf. arnoldii]
MEEIKRLKQDMDRKVAAVEAAMKPRENPVALAPANTSGQSTGKKVDAIPATHQKLTHLPAFGVLGWSENRDTSSTDVIQAPVNSHRDLQASESFQSSSHSTTKPSGGAQADVGMTKDNSGTALSTRNSAQGAESTVNAPLADRAGEKTEENARLNGHQGVAPVSADLPNCNPIGNQSSMLGNDVHGGNGLTGSTAQSSAVQTADQSMSGIIVHSGNGGVSESTERARTDANSRSTSNRTAVKSTIRASESASAMLAPEGVDDETVEEVYGETDEEVNDQPDEEVDDATDERNTDDQSSPDDRDAEMEETEDSELSEESDVSNSKPIDVWRHAIPKPVNVGVPKSVRGVSPLTTVPAPPIKKNSLWLQIIISIRDHRVTSELKQLTQPELKIRIEREILTRDSRIQRCRLLPTGQIRLRTTDFRGNKALQKPSSWRPGAFGKGASVIAHRPKRNVLLP